MTPFNPFDHTALNEDPDDLMELYRWILDREAHDAENPNPLDVWFAQMAVIPVWAALRLGLDPQRVIAEAYGMPPLDRRAQEEVDSAHRLRLKKRLLEELRVNRAIKTELEKGVERSLDAVSPLRVVK